jgi:hypothetical protein
MTDIQRWHAFEKANPLAIQRAGLFLRSMNFANSLLLDNRGKRAQTSGDGWAESHEQTTTTFKTRWTAVCGELVRDLRSSRSVAFISKIERLCDS